MGGGKRDASASWVNEWEVRAWLGRYGGDRRVERGMCGGEAEEGSHRREWLNGEEMELRIGGVHRNVGGGVVVWREIKAGN